MQHIFRTVAIAVIVSLATGLLQAQGPQPIPQRSMSPYRNLGGNSNVVEYESGEGYIKVKFGGSKSIYVYDVESVGKDAVSEMQRLASEGRGLSSYISRHAKKKYCRIEHDNSN